MKKKFTIAILLAAVLSAGATAAGTDSVRSDAAIVRQTVVSDDFDGDEIGDNWTADNGVELDTVYSCMRLRNMNIWQPAIILQAYEVKKEVDCQISFDLSVKTLTGWLGFFVGASSTSVPFYDASSMWMMSADSVSYWENDGANLVENASQKLGVSPLANATGENVVTVKYTLMYTGETADGSTYDIELSFAKKEGETLASQTYTGVAARTYVGFASMANLFVDIMNFRVAEKNAETGEYDEVFFDDFSSGSIVYPGSSNPSANWRVTHTYTSENVFAGALKRISFGGVTSGKLLCLSPLETDRRCEKLFEMKFSLFPETLTENAYFGVGFALSDENSYADSVNMIALRKEGSGAVFVKLVNGVEQEETISQRFALSGLGAGNPDGAQVVMTGYYNGEVVVTVDNTSVCFSGMELDGYFAFAAANSYGKETEGNEISVDNFTLDVFSYKSSDSEDAAINFAGIKEFEQFGATYYEHYYNRNEWYLSGSGVSLAPYRSNGTNDYLQMVNATGNVAFGPKNKVYSDFIVRFSVMMLTEGADTPPNSAVGIAMGKKTRDAVNSDSSCVWFSFNGSSTVIGGINVQTEDGSASVPCSLNLWSDTSVLYNVVMIVSGGTVEVYVKRSTDDISALGTLRAKFVGVNTYGYVALTCNTLDGKKGNCKITDFSITNLQR